MCVEYKTYESDELVNITVNLMTTEELESTLKYSTTKKAPWSVGYKYSINQLRRSDIEIPTFTFYNTCYVYHEGFLKIG